ncbi:MAG: PilN domain-containing protein [Porticoccaceae bacterium]|nr:PilN domain-containing protein [Porticoccaceae bacterium]
MATINLLPWREEYRQQEKNKFLKIGALVLVAALAVVFLWDRVISARLDNQVSRNQLLQQEVAKLDKQVGEISELKRRKQDMLERMEVIQSLQANRPDIVRIFDELVRATPEGVFLVELRRVGEAISITGYAESNNRVSSFMRNLDASYKFVEPNLTRVVANDTLGAQGNRFELRVQVTRPETMVKQEPGA